MTTAVPSIERGADGTIYLRGRLRFDTVAALHQEKFFLDSVDSSQQVLFDLRQVESMDSAGVAMLVDWIQSARERGVRIAFTGAPEQMKRIVRVSGLEELFAHSRQS